MDVSVEVLASQPGASVDELARAAGVARRTFYGHFPTREALIHAVSDDAVASLLEVMQTAREGDHPAAVAYAMFMLGAWRMSDRHRMLLLVGRAELGPDGIVAAMRPVSSQVAELVAAGQADRSFDDRLPPSVLAGILQGTTFALLDALNAGQWDGSAHGAAHACLVVAGVHREQAARIVAELQ